MFKTYDDCLRVEVANNLLNSVFPPADVTILDLPEDKIEFRGLLTNLYHTQTDKQILFLTLRGKKQDKLSGLMNMIDIKPWKLLDMVCLTYQKPGQSNGNCLVQLAEMGFILHKGQKAPNISNTKWFRDGYANAGTHWDLAVQPGESHSGTVFQAFSGELVYLLISLAKPLQSDRSVVYVCHSYDESMLHFIHANKIPFHVYVSSNELANKMIAFYNSLKGIAK
jgi:hypothetical protein